MILRPTDFARVGVMPRQEWKNPNSPNCPLHLRRVCGSCVHFSGATLREKGVCGLGQGKVSGGTDARRCESWSRKAVQS